MLSASDITQNNVIFDLDGTLVDSAPAILDSLAYAFNICNIKTVVELRSEIIGPPLIQMLEMLSGTIEKNIIERLAIEFKNHYDNQGYSKTKMFEGVGDLLSQLCSGGHHLYIATNKRINPTRKILKLLMWDDLFRGVYAIDSFSKTFNKAQLLDVIIRSHTLAREQTIYIGDRDEDGDAARENEIYFIKVDWGYGY